ncbi:serum paraoxonase/arylesterase 2-like [Plakobranchus ocellatus]|uniref:Paraoxonase n=1 Tax=Plakobranchus ocellatus TaxID=259542 RepID=A0AAV4ADY2_9GAST|nr:serum paraoxonase/arylesterase 2-like [Plakobranchus ocellatus]
MYLKIAVISVTLFALQHVVRLIYSLGYHLHFYQHYPGPCRQFQEIEFGSGNFYTLPDGTTFITSGLDMSAFSRGFRLHYTSKGVEGAIYLTKLNSSKAGLIKLNIIVDIGGGEGGFSLDTFHPHGISVWYDPLKGHHTVFVVNHPPKAADRVEKFSFNPESLSLHHIKSFSDHKLRSLHNVQAIGEDSFYVTNVLHENKSRFFMLLELFSLMPWSSVILYSEEDGGYREVVSGLISATGIVMSTCGRFIYVMLSLGSQVLVYKRGKDNLLTMQQVFHLYTHPDSAVLDPVTGDIFIGAHPILHQYLKHIDNPAKHKAASQVLHLRVSQGNVTSITELLYDDGTLISGSSAAIVYNNTLLVGSSVDKLVLIRVNTPLSIFHHFKPHGKKFLAVPMV